MMLQELTAFRAINTFLVRIEAWHQGNQSALDKITEEIASVESSPATRFGLIRRTSKTDKLAGLQTQKAELEKSIKTGDEMLKIAYVVITGSEIPLMRKKKEQRHSLLLRHFSEAKLNHVRAQLEFWKLAQEATRQDEQKSPEVSPLE